MIRQTAPMKQINKFIKLMDILISAHWVQFKYKPYNIMTTGELCLWTHI